MHRSIINYANIVLPAKWQDSCFDRPVQHGVGWLVRSDRSDLHNTLHLVRAKVRDTDPTDFSFTLQIRHHTPGFFDLLIRLRPMHLVEVDGIYPEAAQAVLCLPA